MIDVVVPYVDFQDENWIKTAKENGIDYSEENRFRGQGDFFKYFFRGVAKNLSWVNNIFLLVQSESQVPSWVNKSMVKVVLHKDFIPEQFLPVYNSCTIEMFLGNIKGLSEQFLYFNDDIYVLRELKISDFFIGDKVRQHFIKHFPLSEPYKWHCINGYNLIFNDEGTATPEHSVKPMLKSKVLECFNLYKKEIYDSITTLRTSKNMNGYLYCYYLLKQGLCEESLIKFIYTNRYDNRLVSAVLFGDIVCIGDENIKYHVYQDPKINKKFKGILGEKCKYEL